VSEASQPSAPGERCELTPIVIRANGRDELIVSSQHEVNAYDPDNGELLWIAKGNKFEVIPTPTVGHGLVFCSSGRADPHGACPACRGIGFVEAFEPDLVVPDPTRSLRDGAVVPLSKRSPQKVSGVQRLLRMIKRFSIDADRPFERLGRREQKAPLHGTDAIEGVVSYLERVYRDARGELHDYLEQLRSKRSHTARFLREHFEAHSAKTEESFCR
jgi:hypothetical protein